MRRGKWTAVAAMAASVAMVTAACGSSGSDNGSGDTGGSGSSQSQSEETSSSGSEAGSGSSTESETGSESETPSESSSSESTSESSDTGSSETSSGGDTGNASGAAFKFGYVLPETGDLSYLGPPQIQAMKYALKLINEAGGINGKKVPAPVAGDEANDPSLAAQAATAEIKAHVNAIIGAAATGMTMAIIDKVIPAGIAQCSGSNTGVALTDSPKKMNGDTQLYFRTAPPDSLQGPVLGNLILEDGHQNVAIMYRNDDYGKGLAQSVADTVKNSGGSVVYNNGYDPKTTDFASQVQEVQAANPDAVVTISFEEGFQLWKQLFQAGLTPDKVGIYGADGMRSADGPKENFGSDPGAVDGAKGTAPASVDNPEFIKALKKFAPKLKETQFAPQVFDCTNIFALAADQAKSNDAMDWAKDVIGITKGGTECNTYADCKKLLDQGEDIHYVGASGDLSFTDHGEPGKATIEIYEYENGGKLKSLGTKVSG